jgi:hypothetical protein
VVPNYPHHVVQRGHNKQVVFAQEADFRYYLSTLEDFKALCVKVYGFYLKINLSPFSQPIEIKRNHLKRGDGYLAGIRETPDFSPVFGL